MSGPRISSGLHDMSTQVINTAQDRQVEIYNKVKAAAGG